MAHDSTQELLRLARQCIGDGRVAKARETLEEIYWSQESVDPEVATLLCEVALIEVNLEAAVYWASELAPLVNRPGMGGETLLERPLRRAAAKLPLRDQVVWCERLEALLPGHLGVRRERKRVAEERKRLHRPVLQRSKGFRRQRRYADAAQTIEAALESWPDDAWLLNELAQIRFEEGRVDDAAQLHEKALEVRPNDACAANNLGKIALAKGDRAGARDWFRSVLDGHPADLHAMCGLGRCALAENDEAGARRWFERVLELRSDDPAARMELKLLDEGRERLALIEEARGQRRRGRYRDAQATLLRALATDVTHAEVLSELGWTCLEWGRAEQACKWFGKALRYNPTHVGAGEGLEQCRPNGEPEQLDGARQPPGALGPLGIAARYWPGHDAVLNELGRLSGDGRLELPEPAGFPGDAAPAGPCATLVGNGRSCALAGRFEEAEGWFRKAVATAPDQPGPLVASGDLARLRGDLPRANRLYRQALQVHPSHARALLGLAMVEMKRRHFRQARSWIEAVLDRDPAHAAASAALQRLQTEEEVLLVVGRSRSLRSSGDLEQARRKVQRAMTTFGEHPDLLVEGALVSAGLEARAQAFEMLRRALFLEPDNQAALNLLAVFHLESPCPGATDFEQAERWLRKALDLRSDNTVTLGNLGRLELARNRPAEAAAWYRQVLAVAPDSPRALEGLGEAAFRQGRLDQARQWLEKAWWADDKDRPRLLTALARVCTASGDTAAARQHLRSALELAPDDVRVMTSLAYVALLENELDEAERRLDAARQKRPDDERVLHLLGRVAQARGDYAAARRHYAETLSFHPASVRSLLGLAWTAYEDRNLSEALHWFDQVIQLDPGNQHALTGTGVVKARMGEYDEAQECYRASLQASLHPPALWHWFRVATLEGNVQQLSWFLDAAASTGGAAELGAEVSAWKERVARSTRVHKEGGDVRAFLAEIARSLPLRYRATVPEPFPA